MFIESNISQEKTSNPTQTTNHLNTRSSKNNLTKKKQLKIIHISDTHNEHERLFLPDADILIHTGDFSIYGAPWEVDQFNTWLGTIKHKFKHIIVIAGNHELTFD